MFVDRYADISFEGSATSRISECFIHEQVNKKFNYDILTSQ